MKQLINKFYYSLGRYRALYLLSALELIIFIIWSFLTGLGETYCFDTPSYYSAFDILTTGKIDICRTPLYPLVIGIPKSLFGYSASVFIVYFFQSLVFVCSIRWMGITLEHMTSSKRIAYWFTAIYALYPGILSFCGVILTESLSISLITAVIYLVSEAYYDNSYKKSVFSGLVCLLLWLQRPALIPVTVVMTVFWICILLRRKEKRKTAIYGICSTLVSIIGLSIYAMMFNHEYNRMAISCVSTWNNYSTLREMGIIDINKIESQRLRVAVDSAIHDPYSYNHHEEASKLQNLTSIEELGTFVDDQLKRHPKELLSYLYHHRLFNVLLPETCVFTGVAVPPPIMSITNILYVNTSTVLLLYLIALCLLIYDNIKRHRISYFVWLIFSLFAANFFTVWVGAPSIFYRLLAPNYPIMIAVLCWLLDQLATKAFPRNNNF